MRKKPLECVASVYRNSENAISRLRLFGYDDLLMTIAGFSLDTVEMHSSHAQSAMDAERDDNDACARAGKT